MSNTQFSCYLIGAESLLIQCGEILQQQGHAIHGVVTTAVPLQQWAQSHHIPTFTLSKNLAAELQEREPFDYLFSITNLAILPEALLVLPQKGAINFHDGPLPRYAGLYATSWALLNQELIHGVTWHTMTAAVDEGLLLKQQLFPIREGETAFSLNVKAYEAGIESFAALVADIENNSLQPQTQNLAEKSYFGKYDRPAAAATLDWRQSAAQIAALVHALDFGAYENPLTLPKLFLGDRLAYVSKIKVLPEPIPSTGSGAVPGTLLALTDSSLTLAAADYPVQISGLTALDGSEIAIHDLALRLGDRLPLLDDAIQERVTAVTAQTARQESFWVSQLAALNPVEIPYASHSESSNGRYQRQVMPLSPSHDADHLTAAFAAYLSRLCDNDAFDIAVSYPALQTQVSGLASYFAAELPFRVQLDPQAPAAQTLANLQTELNTLRHKRHTFAWDALARYPQLKSLQASANRALLPVAVVQTDDAAYQPSVGSELTILISANGMKWLYDTAVFTPEAIAAMQSQFATFLDNIAEGNGRSLAQTSLLTEAQYQQLIFDWNATTTEYDHSACMHSLIEAQAAQRPQAIALVHRQQQITYGELNQRANRLARYLIKAGVGPDVIVGVYLERDIDLMVALIGIHKAGGAYLPLDPDYPQDRLAFMVEDAAVPVLLTKAQFSSSLPPHHAQVVRLDADWPLIAQHDASDVDSAVSSENLSYVIYTSGSTGKPKGVMVQHGNVVNFFAGMDERIPHDPPGTWLAVTSLSFDISVLELFWTLARGFKVVLYDGETAGIETAPSTGSEVVPPSPHAHKPIDFSLFYFASDESEEGVADKYNLLLEGAKYGDQNGFYAIWTPERHFHAFGGLYPNPSVASAAIAAITQRIRIHAGSCVLPLHHPVRVVEEWSLVDNISKGRVGIAFAAGWQPNDFALMPQNHARRKEILFENIETVRQLWRGETLPFPGPNGDVMIRTLPRPIQPELPVWVTAAGNPETFRQAGAGGFHILTHLLGQTVEQLGEKLAIYRQAWRDGGHSGAGHVTLMLHTFIGDDLESVRSTVREPMKEYLRSALGLVREAAWHFPTFKQKAEATGKNPMEIFDSEELTDEEMDALLEFAFNRYFETSGLFGTTASVMPLINNLKSIQVDEIACQIDFGVPSTQVLASLPLLNQVKNQAAPATASADFSIPGLIAQHQVTHFQCTPSMARMLLLDERMPDALRQLDVMMVGGEALPAALANQLIELVPGAVINMYGPTETTVWSSTYQLQGGETAVSIGAPIANTQIYILDSHNQPVPPGVPGNLFIGGDGVVRGYLNRPELTAGRFSADPFVPGNRIYATGDLARWLPDGQIDFLGRADFQVKIRGYRIELGEIESLLNAHPAVNEAVVMAREDVPGDMRLVAYLIPAPGQTVTADLLKTYLKADLPAFMVPAHYVVMDAFPLTPNKKTDRKALPAPDQAPAVPTTVAYVPPSNELEQTIVGIWRRVLNVSQVGLNDNFFDLGGHSLLTVQVHRELKTVVDKPIAITDMFRFPTIRSLVAYLDEGKNGENGAAETAVAKSTDRAAARREAMQNRGRGRR